MDLRLSGLGFGLMVWDVVSRASRKPNPRSAGTLNTQAEFKQTVGKQGKYPGGTATPF